MMEPTKPDQIIAAMRKRCGLGDDVDLRVKHLLMAVKADEPTPGVYSATLSTGVVDRDGEVMIARGMDATEFNNNPVVFWNHDYNMPVAKGVGKIAQADDAVRAAFKFADRPADFKGEFFPDFARAMVEQGIVRGVSVGFMPVETRSATRADSEKYGPEVKTVTSKWKMFEFSVAPLPTNQEALIDAVAKGRLTRDQARDVFGVDVPEVEPKATPRCVGIELGEPIRKPRKAAVVLPNTDGPVLAVVAKAKGKMYD